MIDMSKKYWTGDSPEDISEWLRLYARDDVLDVKSVICHTCGGDSFELRVDQNEDAIQVKCTTCGTKKILLDCGDIWADAKPRLRKCSVCKTSRSYNVRGRTGCQSWVCPPRKRKRQVGLHWKPLYRMWYIRLLFGLEN